MAKETFSRRSKFTPEERERAARESLKEPDGDVVARYPGLTMNTLQNWRARLGLKKPMSARGAPVRKDRKKKRGEVAGAKRRARTKTATNGHAKPGTGATTLEAALFDLRQAHHANQRALASLEAVQQAYLRVFGGG